MISPEVESKMYRKNVIQLLIEFKEIRTLLPGKVLETSVEGNVEKIFKKKNGGRPLITIFTRISLG